MESDGLLGGSGTLSINIPTGRLAPTPSGYLHLGNLLAFAAAWLSIRAQNGHLQLRIEDIDTTRSRQAIAEQQKETLSWLGLDWDEETPLQSERDYAPFLKQLETDGYYCQCTRAQIQPRAAYTPVHVVTKTISAHGAFHYPTQPFHSPIECTAPKKLTRHNLVTLYCSAKMGFMAGQFS